MSEHTPMTGKELREAMAKIGLDFDEAYVLDATLGFLREHGYTLYGTPGEKYRGVRKLKAIAKSRSAESGAGGEGGR